MASVLVKLISIFFLVAWHVLTCAGIYSVCVCVCVPRQKDFFFFWLNMNERMSNGPHFYSFPPSLRRLSVHVLSACVCTYVRVTAAILRPQQHLLHDRWLLLSSALEHLHLLPHTFLNFSQGKWEFVSYKNSHCSIPLQWHTTTGVLFLFQTATMHSLIIFIFLYDKTIAKIFMLPAFLFVLSLPSTAAVSWPQTTCKTGSITKYSDSCSSGGA